MRIRKFVFSAVTLALLTAGVVCALCNYAISGGFSWSLTVILSLSGAQIIASALLISKKNRVKNALTAFSVIVIPFLAGLSLILGIREILYLGGIISVFSIGALWGIYFVFKKCAGRIYLALAIPLIIAVPLTFAITHTVCFFTGTHAGFGSDMFHSAGTLALSAVFMVMDRFKGK